MNEYLHIDCGIASVIRFKANTSYETTFFTNQETAIASPWR